MSKIGKISIDSWKSESCLMALCKFWRPLGKASLNLDLEIFDFNIDEGKSFSIKPKN